MFTRNNTMQFTNTIWIVGAIIIANIWLAIDNYFGFLIWIIFAMLLMLMEVLSINSELKMVRRRIRFLKHLEKKEQERKKKPKRKRK